MAEGGDVGGPGLEEAYPCSEGASAWCLPGATILNITPHSSNVLLLFVIKFFQLLLRWFDWSVTSDMEVANGLSCEPASVVMTVKLPIVFASVSAAVRNALDE